MLVVLVMVMLFMAYCYLTDDPEKNYEYLMSMHNEGGKKDDII